MNPTIAIHFPRRVDAAAAPSIESFILQLIAAGATRLILDMTAVEYLGSVGIRRLVVVSRALEAPGGRAILVTGRPFIVEVLRVCGVDDLMPLAEDVDTALAALA